MADYTLYGLPPSGNAFKPALLLQLAGADWQGKFVDMMKGEHRTAEFLALNPMGELPVLIDHTADEAVLTQTGVMLTHLAKRFADFGPRNAAEEREILRWILWDNHKFTGNLSAFRLMNKFQGTADSPEGKFMQARMITAFKTLNRHLEGRDWVATDRVSIADISLAGYCFWPSDYQTDWNDYPNIKAWTERLTGLPNFAMPEDILPGPADT